MDAKSIDFVDDRNLTKKPVLYLHLLVKELAEADAMLWDNREVIDKTTISRHIQSVKQKITDLTDSSDLALVDGPRVALIKDR